MALDIKNLGQVFTPDKIVKQIISLRENKGRILEPSAGDGAFLRELEKEAIGIEVSNFLFKDKRIINSDFFDYSTEEKFDTIIGNPPYVRHQDISSETKNKLDLEFFDRRSNLYLFFIEKCVNHLTDKGEIIFITPRDFLKLTSAKQLNKILYEQGAFTSFDDLGDKKIFAGVSPNCAIWRWQKGKKSKRLNDGRDFCYKNGQIWFGESGNGSLSDYFSVKVGAVSGADSIFTNEKRGCTDFVCSNTAKTGQTKRMIYNRYDTALSSHKQALINRKIKKFDDKNWWEWGRAYPEKQCSRIYVNCKTRNTKPFFTHKAKAFDGSVLALFPKGDFDIKEKIEKLNQVNWSKLGFVCDGRHIFMQRSLENASIEV